MDDGRLYLYYSRNAYRNWVWDPDLDKYVEESNIYAVELEDGWWNDSTGRTMPTVKPSFVNANKEPDDASRRRKDGFVRILDYGHDKQSWENAHVDDSAASDDSPQRHCPDPRDRERIWAERCEVVCLR